MKYNVFARCPENKKSQIVKALQAQKQVLGSGGGMTFVLYIYLKRRSFVVFKF